MIYLLFFCELLDCFEKYGSRLVSYGMSVFAVKSCHFFVLLINDIFQELFKNTAPSAACLLREYLL